jgi:hypothetical protein
VARTFLFAAIRLVGLGKARAFARTVARAIRAVCLWLESRGDSRIGETLIQPVGWAEASSNAEAIFARLA